MNNNSFPPVEYQSVLNRNRELETDIAGLKKALDEKTSHWEEAVNRNRELEADIAGLQRALNEKTSHWEEAVNRNRELEAELVWLHKGNRGLMEELQFLKVKNKELSEMHDDAILKKWEKRNTKKNVMCKYPFIRIEVLENGDILPCCGQWLKSGFSFGNIYNNNSFDEIWNSENAKKLRYSVTEGDFEYCTKYCLYKNLGNNSNISPIVTRNEGSYSFKDYHECYINNLPEAILLSCDTTCNLHCPSCRTHIKVNREQENDKLLNMLNTIIRPIMKNCNSLTCLDSGEFFSSKPIQAFCKTLSKQEFPNLKININTNGQLFTEEKYKEFENLQGMIGRITISVDAAEKQTYETIRLGGKWERLQDALSFISNLRRKNNIDKIVLDFVVQKLNYKQIPPFIKMAKIFNVDMVFFQRLNNWGTFNTEEFLNMDVMDPKNEHYDEAKHLIEEALKEQDIMVVQNVIY